MPRPRRRRAQRLPNAGYPPVWAATATQRLSQNPVPLEESDNSDNEDLPDLASSSSESDESEDEEMDRSTSSPGVWAAAAALLSPVPPEKGESSPNHFSLEKDERSDDAGSGSDSNEIEEESGCSVSPSTRVVPNTACPSTPSAESRPNAACSTPSTPLLSSSLEGSSTWDVRRNADGTSKLEYTNPDDSKNVYTVATTNEAAAATQLCTETLRLALFQKSMCKTSHRCSRKCHDNGLLQEILDRRHEKLKYETKNDQHNFIAVVMKSFSQTGQGRVEFKIGRRQVCYNFFLKACVISKNTYARLRKLSNSNSTAFLASAPKRKEHVIQELYCIGFWRMYFEAHCQTSDGETFYWPTGITMNFLYEKKFPKYFANHSKNAGPVELPSLSTFYRARGLPEFQNVKKRTKHFHLKCTLCSILNEERKHGFVTKEMERLNTRYTEEHSDDVRDWRAMEKQYTDQALHDPASVNVFKIDDTTSVSFPHCGHRTAKSVAKLYKLPVVPCLVESVALNFFFYIYSLKGQQKKGGNRFCTTMHSTMKSVKNDPGPASQARKAVIIGDNYNENRNLTIFCFYTERNIFLNQGPKCWSGPYS